MYVRRSIERWQREIYPALARRAKGEGADIFFWDESGFRADAVHGNTWGRRGETPVVHRPLAAPVDVGRVRDPGARRVLVLHLPGGVER